jgi:hypothetical protein
MRYGPNRARPLSICGAGQHQYPKGLVSQSPPKQGACWLKVLCKNQLGAQGADGLPSDPVGAGHVSGLSQPTGVASFCPAFRLILSTKCVDKRKRTKAWRLKAVRIVSSLPAMPLSICIGKYCLHFLRSEARYGMGDDWRQSLLAL